MSATTVFPNRFHPRPRFRRALAAPVPVGPAPGYVARLRTVLRRVGAPAIAALGFAGAFGWAFFGSLALGLGTPAATDTATAWLWLAGEVCVVTTAAAAGWLAAEDGREPSGE